ncbi:MAG TPA: DUF5667 domain-containing protein, partial [Anaerolineae bacterium]|nr:DUF5667 domain-containing protein [Anaerolineae bacterium]
MTTEWELDDILEQSLTRIAAGEASVEDCLDANPAVAVELEPLLRAAERIRAIPIPGLSLEARDRIEQRVLPAAAAKTRLRSSTRRWPRTILRRWPRACGAIAAILIVVFLMMTTLMSVSASALPGSALYPLKLATESAWLWVTPDHREADLHLHLARRRLVEIEELATQGQIDQSVVGAMDGHMERALDHVDRLSPASLQPFLDDAALLIDDQQKALTELMNVVPIESRTGLEKALEETEQRSVQVETLRKTLRNHESSATPTPTEAPSISEWRAVTRTPGSEPNPGVSLSPTVKPSRVPTQETVATRDVSPTPEPSTEASKTPKPTKTPKPDVAPSTGRQLRPTRTPKPTKTPKPLGQPEMLGPTETPTLAETPTPTGT